jgi:hypothetical protein
VLGGITFTRHITGWAWRARLQLQLQATFFTLTVCSRLTVLFSNFSDEVMPHNTFNPHKQMYNEDLAHFFTPAFLCHASALHFWSTMAAPWN